jgi:C-terminal processing protease CtpA/Prc|tara:strand:+ start:630 stop:953 length:324 start_codon:yes stop_codon:yes gene_type:complete
MVRYHATPNGNVQFTAEEEAEWDAIQTDWASKKVDRKLAQIKQIRLEKLESTDWMSNSDVTMPNYIKTWRQSLRDIPTNYTTESKYDELLEKENGALKHSIWKQPTE